MAGRALGSIGGQTTGRGKTLIARVTEPTALYAIRWLGAAAADRRRITRYIAQQSREVRVAISFMDTLMSKIELLGHGTVQFKPGCLAGTREYVVHPNYIVVYRVNEVVMQVDIIRLWNVWTQPG
jgi:toxin ParE1/3/4